jgi:valyl-tRNA synthetase
MNMPAGAKIPLTLVGASTATKARVARHEDTIKRLARLDMIGYEPTPPKGSAQMVVGEATVCLPLVGVIDMSAEKKRLGKAIADVESDMAKMDAKLSNPSFMAKAKPDAVEEAQERKAELDGQLTKLRAALRRVEAAA